VNANGESAPATALAQQGDAQRITAALLYMLVQLATRGACANVIAAIGQHLEMLAAQRDIGPMLRSASLRLHDQWRRSCPEAQAAAAAEAAARRAVH
jgi:hypothetical protein